MPCTTMLSGRDAVTRGSFCRSDPAAALRGLANGALPASTSRALSSRELLDREEHLAAHLEQPGTSSPASSRGHGGDGAHVERDVLAGRAVAAGQRAHQSAVLVEQVDGHAVDLELAQVVDGGRALVALDALGPGRRAPRPRTRCRGSSSARCGRPPRSRSRTCRRPSGSASRACAARGALLERLQLAHQLVVFARR